ncbi:MAG: MFS transporter [Rhodospirillaceae bacterium]|nr:MFS transporter [Rhodospirillaceae bacterium]
MKQRELSSWLAIGFSGIGHTYSHLFAPIFFTLVPLALEQHLGLSHGETVSLIVAGNLLFGFAAPVAGWLGDRWSSTGMMALFYLGTGAGMVMVGFSDTPFAMAFWLGVTGLFASIYHPVGIAWLVRVSLNTGTALGINGAFGAMGAALGAIATGILIDTLGWRAAYIVPGSVVLITFIAFTFCLMRGWIVESKDDRKPAPPPASRGDTMRVVGILGFTMVCGGLIANATSPALPKAFSLDFSQDAGGVMTVSFFVGLVYAAAGIMQMIGGKLADALPVRRVYFYGYLIQVPILLAAGWVGGTALVGIAILMVSVNFGVLPAENMLVVRYAPSNRRALIFGLKFVLALGISSLGVLLEGAIFDFTGNFTALFATLAGLALAGGTAISLLPRERAAAAQPEPAE